jgi:hypothetical protein
MANYWKLFKKARAFYFSLGKIKCPAFNGEEIIFDQRGFKHFLFKSKGKRSIADQIRRFKLLFKIYDLIGNARLIGSREIFDPSKKLLWSLLYTKDDEYIKMVVLENELNKKYFISIMDKN